MSKKMFAFGIILSLILVAALPMAVMAGAFSSYTSGFQVQNLSSSTANITITYFNQDGSTAISPVSDTIDANGSKTYYPIAPSAGFNGSVVISSDQQVASVVNVLASGSSNASASYDAAMQGGSPIYVPLLMKNNGSSHTSTWFNVQNAGSIDATVNVAYSDATAAGPVTIKAGAAHTFDQLSETHNASVFLPASPVLNLLLSR